MNVAAATRFARQLALPEVGAAGQERLAAARAVIVGDGLAAETAARYLAAAGVGTLRLLGDGAGSRSRLNDAWDAELRGSNPDVAIEHAPRPTDGVAWMEALEGVSIVVRADFDDDALVPAAVRRAVPLVVLRGDEGAADVVSFRKHGPCPHAPLDVMSIAAIPIPDGPASVVAGTLAAAEALHVLIGHDDTPARASRARHLRVPLDGGEPVTQDLPWTPECFACGGSGSEMSFA
jgi:sulfur-carrier protein adenylyltransferase/sulfurtransferase